MKGADRLRGSLVPLVTPFRNGAVDWEGFVGLVEWQIASGTHGLVITGTTGEPSALSFEERVALYRLAVEGARGRVPVIAGTGTNNFEETLRLSQAAQAAGVDALLVVVPYYVRPSQEGLFQYFKGIAERVDLPVILYNIPGRTAAHLEIDTVARLREACPNIVGIKEANKDFEHINRLLHRMGTDFLVYSGIELLCFPVLAIGGAGYVSATGNVLPDRVARLYDLAAADRWREARDLHYQLLPLNDALFIETNPVPAKTALAMMGKISPEVRLPLAPMRPENVERLRQVLKGYGLIE
ncbi:4-hydroxy-tetrahydrodipicolinate synthase [Thermoflexus sp.]|uniref:4-hydroxy-tetrahydrodipicolinate synthase n=1 Tax=Thermoflexus sp. TaxID=1969742 RepID=UPI0035E42550